jgi:hypothetical protein
MSLHVTIWEIQMARVAERVKQHRDGLRRAGLRPIQIWVPDIRRPGFADECARQSLKLRDDPDEAEISTWLQAVADTEGWR